MSSRDIMSEMPPAAPLNATDEVMFSASVREEQKRQGSRDAYERRSRNGGFAPSLSDDAIAFIRERESAYLATASADGQPYVQHRGGPQGFIHVLDRQTVAFPEYPGNRQFISAGHLAENERTFLFLMDYTNARRLKLWGTARVTHEPELLAGLGAPPAVKRATVFTVRAVDWNCSKYIPRLIRQQSETS
jgi:predicted pyridoxine 5'-phosphate oxidase superfamily flavin-nucleotide-binding protein